MPLLFRIAAFLSLLAISITGASALDASKLSFQSFEIYSVSEDSTQIIESSRQSIVLEDPYIIWKSIAEHLPQRFEIHANILQTNSSSRPTSNVLSLYLPATYELYWDGILIGANGTLSPEGKEQPIGNSYNTFALPQSPTIEPSHALRIRGAHTHTSKTGHALILSLQPLEDRLKGARTTAITYSLYLGFALFGICLLAYFALNRDQIQYLLLGSTCVLFGLYAVNKLIYYQLNVTYTYLDWIGLVANSINLSLSLLAPATLLYFLRVRTLTVYALIALPYFLFKTIDSLDLIPATAYICLVISIGALLLRRPHALQATFVSTLLVFNYELPILAANQAIGFGVLMLFFLVSIINLLIKENHQRAQAKLRNTRLQLELLKSKIQPHFVLNSLTSAIEWIETNPKEGVKLIQELAKEFDLLSSISDQALIPLYTEIESCRTYLRIMEYRKKAKYDLLLHDLDLDAQLPPFIIRNLLENAITHNNYGQGDICFHLFQSTRNNQRLIRFTAPLRPVPPQGSTKPKLDGTGIQYIKARLAESYQNWSFKHGPESENWVTEITTPLSPNT